MKKLFLFFAFSSLLGFASPVIAAVDTAGVKSHVSALIHSVGHVSVSDTSINQGINLVAGVAESLAPAYSGLIVIGSSILTFLITLIFAAIHKKITILSWLKDGKILADDAKIFLGELNKKQ